MDDPRPWPPVKDEGAKKPSVRLSLVGKGLMNGKPAQLPPAMAEKWLGYTRKTYQDSGLFSGVKAGAEGTELRAEVEVLDSGRGSRFLAWITGFTLGLVPCSGTDDFTWKTTFKDAAGYVRGTIEKKESVTMWIEILLIFGYPFSPPGPAAAAAIESLNRSTLLDAFEKGYLRP